MTAKMKKYLVIIVIVLAIIAIPLTKYLINRANDYVRVTALDYKAVLLDEPSNNGKVRVTERITFDVHAASKNNTYWELWRALPEEWENGQRVVGYDVKSVKRLTVDGKDAYLEFGKASQLYWDDYDYISSQPGFGPNKWFHSKGEYDGVYNFECVLIYVNGLYRETTVFEIEYEIYGTSIRYNDCSELYLPMYGDDTAKYLNSFSAEILIPENKMPSSGNYSAWTYGTNAHEFPFTESTATNPGYNTFSFSLNKQQLKFKAYNSYIEFALVAHGQDKHKLPTDRSYNMNVYPDVLKAQADYEKLPGKYLNIKIIVLILFLIISALTVLIIFLVDKKLRKKYKFTKPLIKYDYYREIPSRLDANFAGAFVFCKHKILSDDAKGGYSAAMLGLVRKRYIEVERINQKKDWSDDNVMIIITGGEPNQDTVIKKELTQTESAYFKLIQRHAHKKQISLSNFQERVASDYEYTDSFVKNTKASVKAMGVTQNYFKEHDYKKLKRSALKGTIVLAVLGIIMFLVNLASYKTRLDLAFGAFFVLGCAFFASAFILNRLSRSYVLLTQLGEDEYSKWRGLYNFLNSETLMKERTVPEIEIWEDYLLYATAFGISKKVLKALNVRFPEFNMNNSVIIRHPYFSTIMFTRMYTRSFRGATRRASFTGRTGGFGGGGYGGYGGGRGGGGGGGGH